MDGDCCIAIAIHEETFLGLLPTKHGERKRKVHASLSLYYYHYLHMLMKDSDMIFQVLHVSFYLYLSPFPLINFT